MYSVAGEVTQYSSVQKMIEEFSDFSTSNGTFKVIENNPLHIQLSPLEVKRESLENIKQDVNRALIYGIYNAFIHTSIDKITVTVIPQEIDLKTRKTKLLTVHKRTISKTRKEAFSLVKKYLSVKSFSNLVTPFKIEGLTFYQWSKDFKRLYYNDQGRPGLNRFVAELAK